MSARRQLPARVAPLTPRFVDRTRLAAYLGKSPSWLTKNLGALVGEGFPARDDLLGGWDLRLVDEWLNTRGGRPPVERRRPNAAFQ